MSANHQQKVSGPGMWTVVMVAAAIMSVSMSLRQCFGLSLVRLALN
jgi:hypothetical protein